MPFVLRGRHHLCCPFCCGMLLTPCVLPFTMATFTAGFWPVVRLLVSYIYIAPIHDLFFSCWRGRCFPVCNGPLRNAPTPFYLCCCCQEAPSTLRARTMPRTLPPWKKMVLEDLKMEHEQHSVSVSYITIRPRPHLPPLPRSSLAPADR